MKTSVSRTVEERRGVARALVLLASLTVTPMVAAQFGPMSSSCATPWPMNIPYRCGNSACQWYPDVPETTNWADRRPTAEIRLSNGNYNDNDRGLYDLWWDATFEDPPITCVDTLKNDWSAFNIDTNWFEGDPNGRPDQFDWLIAHLDHRYALGYRRIVLYAPAGVASCQYVPPSQWWPMAEWRRDWFEETGVQGQPQTWGLAGWIDAHPDVQVGIYMGWAIEDPCSLCMQSNDTSASCTTETTICPDKLLYPCFGAPAAHYPLTTNQTDMGKTWQNVAPWRDVGIQRFWLDFAAVSAHNGSTELLQFAYNPALFSDSIAPLIFGGEAFPLSDENAMPAPPRYTVDWPQFTYMPFVIELFLAEKHYFNGEPCPVPFPREGHNWILPTLASQRREAAIWPLKLPTCPDGNVHPDWNGIEDEGPNEYYYPFERLENLYQWYICKGFTFWQGGVAQFSGYAERLFSFGKIKPPGDFDGDGEWTPADWAAYDAQYTKWSTVSCSINPETQVLTYYHGDMDSDGDVDGFDLAEANFVIRLNQHPLPQYWLGEEETHAMKWDPNVKWFPCGCETPPSSAFGPP